MDDDSGLELSLGLSCGRSIGTSKIRDVPSNIEVEEGGRSKSVVGHMTASDPSFKNFFQTATENRDHKGKQKSDADSQQQDNFWTDLVKCPSSVVDHSNDAQNNISQFARYQELWSSNNKTAGSEEEKAGLNKRKLPFEETNLQSKHEKLIDCADRDGKKPTGVSLMRNSHISMATGDVSSGENEDVAESEAEGSNSWLVSQLEDKSKSSDIPKFTDKHVLSDSSGIGSQRQKEPSGPGNESQDEPGKVTYGFPLPVQPLPVMTVPYPVPIKVPNAASVPNMMGFPSSCVMQLMPLPNSERAVVQGGNTSNCNAFGYSSVQLPTLETGPSWAFTQLRHVTTFASRDHTGRAPNSQHSEDDAKESHVSVKAPYSSSEAARFEGKSMDLMKSSGKLAETGTSQTEAEGNGNFAIFRPKEAPNQPALEGFSQEGSTIRPGIASNVKFGGSGSYPNLPWVSATGPNGKTISGVTYKYSQNQVKIVCACHGTHMSPEEFVQHASADVPTQENNTTLASFPGNNAAASAKS